MHGPLGVLFIFFFMLPLGVVVGVIYLFVRMLKGRKEAEPEANTPNETQMIQEMYQSLNRMEQRIEALETILLEGETKGEGR